MAFQHPRIEKQLGDGWSMVWDTTYSDPLLRAEMDSVIAEQAAKLNSLLAGSLRQAQQDAQKLQLMQQKVDQLQDVEMIKQVQKQLERVQPDLQKAEDMLARASRFKSG